MPNAFAHRTRRPGDPAQTVFGITPDDGADLVHTTTALNVATPGTVRVTTADGTTEDLTLQSGYSFPIRAVRVWQTGTTATGIKGLV